MAKTHVPYAPEFRRQMVELVRAGRDPADLAREFEPSSQAIRNWVAQADRQEGGREGRPAAAAASVLSAAEREELARLRRETKQLRLERDILSRAAAELRPGLPARPARSRPGLRVHEREPGRRSDQRHGARARRLQGYYAWLRRPPSAHAQADAALLKQVRTAHASSRGTYGAPRVHAELRVGGERHSRKRVARLMREAGLIGASRRRHGPVTTQRDKEARPAPDLVDRDFSATAPNQLWVADITYVPTAVGVLYLAVVLDAWSRRIVGWSMANHLRAELVLDVLEMAVGQRRRPRDVIHHTDQGSQYPSLAFGKRCKEAGVRPSMGSVGDA